MILAAPRRAWLIAAVATAASVVGGGVRLLDRRPPSSTRWARPVLAFYGKTAYFDDFRARYNEWGAWGGADRGRDALSLQGHHHPVGN